ncbi:hypothetical protein Slin14017_G123050 [Septoria linicola]|nr:hypothetical protein Slin14017_G123050 [Septoria linicola]
MDASLQTATVVLATDTPARAANLVTRARGAIDAAATAVFPMAANLRMATFGNIYYICTNSRADYHNSDCHSGSGYNHYHCDFDLDRQLRDNHSWVKTFLPSLQSIPNLHISSSTTPSLNARQATLLPPLPPPLDNVTSNASRKGSRSAARREAKPQAKSCKTVGSTRTLTVRPTRTTYQTATVTSRAYTTVPSSTTTFTSIITAATSTISRPDVDVSITAQTQTTTITVTETDIYSTLASTQTITPAQPVSTSYVTADQQTTTITTTSTSTTTVPAATATQIIPYNKQYERTDSNNCFYDYDQGYLSYGGARNDE